MRFDLAKTMHEAVQKFYSSNSFTEGVFGIKLLYNYIDELKSKIPDIRTETDIEILSLVMKEIEMVTKSATSYGLFNKWYSFVIDREKAYDDLERLYNVKLLYRDSLIRFPCLSGEDNNRIYNHREVYIPRNKLVLSEDVHDFYFISPDDYIRKLFMICHHSLYPSLNYNDIYFGRYKKVDIEKDRLYLDSYVMTMDFLVNNLEAISILDKSKSMTLFSQSINNVSVQKLLCAFKRWYIGKGYKFEGDTHCYLSLKFKYSDKPFNLTLNMRGMHYYATSKMLDCIPDAFKEE